MRLIGASLLVLFAGPVPLQQAAAAEQISAERLMDNLHDRGTVALPPDTVVTGDLVLQEGVSLDAEDATFEGIIATLPLPRGTPPPRKLGSLVLPGGHFKKAATIAELSLETFACRGCTFERDADFHSNRVRRMLLDDAVFRRQANFIATTVEEELHLNDARFDGAVNFAAARIKGFQAVRLQAEKPIVIGWNQFGNEWAERERTSVFSMEDQRERNVRAAQVREEFRFWRRNFQALDLEEDAREANYALVKLNRREELELYNPTSYAPYVLALGSGYGTDPYRPFWVAVIATVLFALIFALIGFSKREEGVTTELRRRYWLPYGTAFSVQTIVPFLTIPGIKDSKWELRHLWWLESLEGVVGVLIFGIAAYSAAVTL